jgi:hypothetical protein
MTDERQGQLFDPTRYSPISVAVFQRLPESSARAFAIAAALGAILDKNGTTRALGNGKQASGSLVRRDRLPAILLALGIQGQPLSTRQWRRYVAAWEHEFVAHRCGPGLVFLFRLPFLSECPACKAWISIDHIAKSSHLSRGAGFRGRSGTVMEDAERPQSGAGTSAEVAQERPRLSTPDPHRVEGLRGVAVGVSLQAFEVEGLSKSRMRGDRT